MHYYTTEIIPQEMEYRRTLSELRPDQVRSMHLATGGENDYGHFVTAVRRQLGTQEVAALLPLVSRAKTYVPDHAHGGWLCVLEIETTTPVKHFEFEVHLSENNGTLLKLHSKGRSGWNYGTLRNDDLEPVLRKMAAEQATR